MSRSLLLEGLDGEPAAILIEDGRIAALGRDAIAADQARRVACHGFRAVPGFVELQVNGLDDCDFTTDPAAMWRVGGVLARHGVTTFLPTIVSSAPEAVEAALRALADRPAAIEGAVPLGLHLEGPFIAPAKRGAHDAAHLRPPDLGELEAWVAGGARIVTVAPELPGAIEAVERIAAAGAVAAIGHTEADAVTTRRAIDAGARFATHLFNAMPPLHHRDPGAVGAVLDDERVTIGLIADGVHVDPLVLRLVDRLARGRIALVGDAVAGRLAGAALAATDDAGRLPDGTLAGGRHLLDHGVRTYAAATGSSDAAIAAASVTPAAVLGLDDHGMLQPGARADVTLLDADLRVAATLVGGTPVHRGEVVSWR